jgi:hypothetical protein
LITAISLRDPAQIALKGPLLAAPVGPFSFDIYKHIAAAASPEFGGPNFFCIKDKNGFVVFK